MDQAPTGAGGARKPSQISNSSLHFEPPPLLARCKVCRCEQAGCKTVGERRNKSPGITAQWHIPSGTPRRGRAGGAGAPRTHGAGAGCVWSQVWVSADQDWNRRRQETCVLLKPASACQVPLKGRKSHRPRVPTGEVLCASLFLGKHFRSPRNPCWC